METPLNHLPKPIPHEAIKDLLVSVGLPKATNIVSPKVTAEFHSIYMLSIPPNDKTSNTELVLRVSGHHLPYIKTANEVGVMTWIAKSTKIPIPELVAYDDSDGNEIGHEYTLLARVSGDTLSDIYSSLDEKQVDGILDQLADILVELHSHKWHGIGGLNLDTDGSIYVAQVIDETFRMVPDLELWPKSETLTSLNVSGPYSSITDYVSAHINLYIHLIKLNDKLAFMRDDIPRLEAFVSAISSQATELNQTNLVLAHKDLHFANILYDRVSSRITAILDWEFSGIVPSQQWNPRRAFLWTGQLGEGMAEKRKLWDRFVIRCEERNISFIIEDAAFTSLLQEAMDKVVNFVRAIVEVGPTGQRKDTVMSWRETALENIARFGV
ncbi:hypothetical protein M426DRAFT_319672 [Hypoxylon sp. CI-4A]|nr:hypothetical protein M426DRAFT_319672 [Hypoxylon sp. CI-4A]